jgi:hypothetical protein
MRKIFAFILLLFYFSFSTGFVLSMHYCMNRLDSAQLGSSNDDQCHKCGMHKDGKCCHDEVAVVKLQTAHMAADLSSPDFSILGAATINTRFFFALSENILHKQAHINPGPPLLTEQEIYLQNGVFRI